ncbi:MAG TPA: hypothetical protein VIE65_12470 [Methylobacter sp.]|jgi:hypothetical protein
MEIDQEEIKDRIAELCVAMKLKGSEIISEIRIATGVEVDESIDDLLAPLGDMDLFKVFIHFERLDAML